MLDPCQWKKRVERCTGRNLPSIFTKPAINVYTESQEMSLSIVFGGNIYVRKWNRFVAPLPPKNSFNVKYLKNCE